MAWHAGHRAAYRVLVAPQPEITMPCGQQRFGNVACFHQVLSDGGTLATRTAGRYPGLVRHQRLKHPATRFNLLEFTADY
jgi:hypothetical protein